MGKHAVIAAVVIDGDLRLSDRPNPEPVADQVLVEVAGTGVNRADLLQMKGLYPAPSGWPPDVPGLEFSGRVASVGPLVQSLRDGEEVFGIVGGGAHSTHVLTTEELCVRVPAGVDLVEAGGIPEVFITAHDALVTQAAMKSGDRVLIHGVGSGVGTAAVLLINALGGVSVGTARTPEKLERAADLGLDKGVLAGEDMADEIGEVDVVLDLVGGDYLRTDVAVAARSARIMIIGLLAGARAEVDLGALMQKRVSIKGTTLRMRPEWEKAQATAAFADQVVPLFESGALRPVTDRVLPFDDIRDAYDAVASNETFGKVVLATKE